MGTEPKGGPFPDAAGCICSYPLGEGPNEISIPPGSYWFRNERRRFKLYVEEPELGNNAMSDLKKIPGSPTRAIVRAEHNGLSSNYDVSWF